MLNLKRHIPAALTVALATTTTSLAFADTLNVPADFSSIQAAVDAASDGDTVKVRGGTYEEFVVVDKQIKLDGRRSPLLVGSIDIQADGVTVQGFDIIRELVDNGFAIQVVGDDAKIRRNEIQIVNLDDDDGEGILVLGNGSRIKGNQCSGGSTPIDVRGDDNDIFENIAFGAVDVGIEVTGDSNLLEDNEAFGTGTEGVGMRIRGIGNTLIDNKSFDNDNGFSVGGADHLLQGNDADNNDERGYGVNCDFCVFNGLNQAMDNGVGFDVSGSGNLFDDNEADDSEQAGWIISGSNNTFIGNGADNNAVGMIEKESASGNMFQDNSCKDNDVAAIPASICDDPND